MSTERERRKKRKTCNYHHFCRICSYPSTDAIKMEELDAILNDLQTIAKDVGFEVPTISATTTGSPASTVDTGFDSASDSYNYSTVKRAPPKTPQVPQLPAPKPVVEEHLSFGGDFGLDKILASLDELENKHEPQKTTQPQTSQVRHVSFKSEQPPPPTPPKPSVKPMPPSRPRPSPKPSFTQQHQPIIKPEPIVSSPAPAPTPPALVKMHHHGTLEREKPPPPATPPRTDVKYGTNPRLMTGHAPQPLANIFRNQLSAKKMERTSSYSSDHSDRSGSSSVGPPPPHSPSSSSGGGAYRLSFPPPGRMPPPPMTTTTTAPTMSYHQHQMDMQMAPPPPPPPMDQHLASEKVFAPPESTKSEPNYMELSHANPYKNKSSTILKSSPAISIHTDISRDSGFASTTQDAEFESHYRQLNEYTEVYIYVNHRYRNRIE